MTIHPKFAHRVSIRYVDIYQKISFEAAQTYLERMIKGDKDTREQLVPYIVEEGRRRK